MALPKHNRPNPAEAADDETHGLTPVLGPVERLRAIFDDLREHAPPIDEDDGWDELAEALDAERPEGMKLFPK